MHWLSVDKECILNLRELLKHDACLSGWEGDNIRATRKDRTVGRVSDIFTFSSWNEENRYVADCINNEIIIREFSFVPHAYARSQVIMQFYAQDKEDTIEIGTLLDMLGRVNLDIYTPDVVINAIGQSNIPLAGRSEINEYPVIVIEIGTSQTLKDLHQRAAIFLSNEFPSCEYYIGIKRYDPRLIDGLQAMVAGVYDRATITPQDPSILISFGTGPLHPSAHWSDSNILQGVGVPLDIDVPSAPCNMAGLPQYTITLPASRIFSSRIGGVPAGAPTNFTLDLFLVQKKLAKPITYA